MAQQAATKSAVESQQLNRQVSCTVCRDEATAGEALCASCIRRLDNPPGLCPEQIAWTTGVPTATGAALIDQWGRAHHLRDTTVIGRIPGDGLAVLQSSISRCHAEVVRDGHQWSVRDLNSRNGTHVSGRAVAETSTLRSNDVVTFGDVAFYFLERTDLDVIAEIQVATEGRPGQRCVAQSNARLRLAAPPGEVGGIAEIDGVAVRLSAIQFAFVAILAERADSEDSVSHLVRGYVGSAELLNRMPWDTPTPVADNVKQLVRRVRSTLKAAGFGDVIESRHRFGYRLRLVRLLPS